MVKKSALVVSFLLSMILVNAQSDPSTSSLDKSQMDMSYFPADYPVLKIQDKAADPLVARVIYSRPQKKGRKLFGSLVAYGQVWRLGANEATEIEFFRDVQVGGQKVKKGRYTLYALVDSDKWTFILNKETDTWGAFRYDIKKDVVRTQVPVQKQATIAEAFSIDFQKTSTGADLVASWDDVLTRLPIAW